MIIFQSTKKIAIFILVNLLCSSHSFAKENSRSWEKIGPKQSAIISGFTNSQSDSNRVYSISDGTLFNSSDSGQTWSEIKTQGNVLFRAPLRVDSIDPLILYLVIDGVLSKSTDGGIHWKNYYPEVAIDNGSFFKLNPPPMTKSLKVLINNDKVNRLEQTLAISIDGGETWGIASNAISKINDKKVTIEGINSKSSDILYGTILNGKKITVPGVWRDSEIDGKNLFKSTDGGLSWFAVQPPASHEYLSNLTIHPIENNIIYAEYLNSEAHRIDYMRSSDGGENWIRINPPHPHRLANLTLDPSDPNILYAHLRSEITRKGFGFAVETFLGKSIDSGKSWKTIKRGILKLEGIDGSSVVIVNAKNNQNLFYPSSDGAYISIDGGETWSNSQSSVRRVTGKLAVADINSNVMYLVSNSDHSFYNSLDAGEHWNKSSINIESSDICTALIINPVDSQNLLCQARGTGSLFKNKTLYKSTDAGENWKSVKTIENRGEEHVSYAHDGKTIYYLHANILSKSSDDGDSWNDIQTKPSNLIFNANQTSEIIVDPRNENIIYAVGSIDDAKGVYKSIDGGENWAKQFDAPSDSSNFRMLIHPFHPDRLIFVYFQSGTRNQSISNPGSFAFITDNGGNSWRQLQLPGSFLSRHKLLFNPRNIDGLFYASTEGLYETKDLGVSWNIVNKGYHTGLKTSSDYVYSDQSTSIFRLSSPVISSEDKDCLFNWAEQQSPDLFSPSFVASEQFNDYTYRFYSGSNTYLGVFQDEKIHLLQPNLSEEIKDVGFFEYYQHLAGCD